MVQKHYQEQKELGETFVVPFPISIVPSSGEDTTDGLGNAPGLVKYPNNLNIRGIWGGREWSGVEGERKKGERVLLLTYHQIWRTI